MGTLTSATDHSGMTVGKVTLGRAARDVDAEFNEIGEYRWDDGRLPSGTIGADGTITPDSEGI